MPARTAPSVLTVLLLAAFVPAEVHAQLPDSTAAADSVETLLLQFDWPVGLTADVEAVTRREQGDQPPTEILQRYVMEVLPGVEEGELLVRHRNGEMTDFLVDGEAVSLEDNPMVGLLRALSRAEVDYRVSEEGEFLGVADFEETRRELDTFIQSMLGALDSMAAASGNPAGSGEALAGIRGMMENMASEEALMTAYADSWSSMVWFWAWEEFDLGYSYLLDSETPSPLVPGLVIPMEVEAGVYERAPCHDGAPEDSCVVLEFLSTPDAEAALPALRDFLQSLMGPDEAVEVASMVQENFIQVISEPGTLIPHRMITSQVTEMELSADGESEVVRQVQEVEVTFRYR